MTILDVRDDSTYLLRSPIYGLTSYERIQSLTQPLGPLFSTAHFMQTHLLCAKNGLLRANFLSLAKQHTQDLSVNFEP